jgi:hypothetical protein
MDLFIAEPSLHIGFGEWQDSLKRTYPSRLELCSLSFSMSRTSASRQSLFGKADLTLVSL